MLSTLPAANATGLRDPRNATEARTHGTHRPTFSVLTLPVDSFQEGVRAEATAASPRRSRQPSATERAMTAIPVARLDDDTFFGVGADRRCALMMRADKAYNSGECVACRDKSLRALS